MEDSRFDALAKSLSAAGPRTGAVTFVGFHRGTGWSAVGREWVRAVLEVDAADVLHGDGVGEVVGFDGTVLESFPAPAVGARIAVVPLEATGTPAP